MDEDRNNQREPEAAMSSDWTLEKKVLSPTSRLSHEPNLNCYIVTVIGFKTSIDHEVIKAGLPGTLLRHPRFFSKMVRDFKRNGKMEWVRTNVNLDDHIIVPSLDPDQTSPDRFVEDYISYLTTTPLDGSRPLWEMHLLNIKTSDAEALMILRFHHSIGDGASLMSLLLACTRKTSDTESLPTMPTKTRDRTVGSHGLWWLILAVWSLIKLVLNTLSDTFLFVVTVMFLKDTPTPIKGKPGVGETTKRFVHRIISLDDIKMVKNGLNMTVNDVLLGVTQAGLSSYLHCRYAECENRFPKRPRLRGIIAMNLRPVSGIQSLTKTIAAERSTVQWGNLIGYVLFPFSVSHQEDTLEYVRQAQQTMERKKLSLEATITLSIATIILKIFGSTVAASLVHRFIFNATLGFSNMVGPLEEVSYCGHPIAYIAPTVYGLPTALVIHFQSYADKMTFVVAVDPEIIPDPHLLCDHLVESLNTIKTSVLNKRKHQ